MCAVGLFFYLALFFLLTEWPLPVYNDSTFDGQTISLIGEVSQKEYKNGKYQIYLKNACRSDSISSNDDNRIEKSGVLLYLDEAYDSAKSLPPIGCKVCVKGKKRLFETASNPGQFDTARYYRAKGIDYYLQSVVILRQSDSYSRCRELLFQVRAHLYETLISIMGEEDAAMIAAMLLGERNLPDPEKKELYRRSGAGHLLVVSGLHISLVGYGLLKGLKKVGVPLRVSAILTSVLIYSYALLTGMGTSTQRALIMFLIALFGECIGRAYDLLTALAVSSIVLLLMNPFLAGDSGFLLSFGSILGIGILLPVLNWLLPGKGKVLSSLKASLSVSVFTFPITLYFFYQYPVYSIFWNLLYVPLMTVLFASGAIAMITALLFQRAARVISFLPKAVLWVYDTGNHLYGEMPGGTWITGAPQKWQIAVFYFLLTGALFMSSKRGKTCRKRRILTAILLVGAVAAVLLCKRPEWQISVLDVGQGDCNYLRYREFECLIDGGSSDVSEVFKYRIAPFLKQQGVQELDCIFISHMDADHVNGIEELIHSKEENGIRIGCILTPPVSEGDETYQRLKLLSQKAGIPVRVMKKGDCIEHGALKISCFYPLDMVGAFDDKNENSMVLKVENGAFRALFTGDLEGEGEERLLTFLPEEHYTLLKAGHHGSKGASSEALLKRISPDVVTVSCGAGNSYGHPHREFLRRVLKATDMVYITKDCGAITFMGNENGKIKVKCCKEKEEN